METHRSGKILSEFNSPCSGRVQSHAVLHGLPRIRRMSISSAGWHRVPFAGLPSGPPSSSLLVIDSGTRHALTERRIFLRCAWRPRLSCPLDVMETIKTRPDFWESSVPDSPMWWAWFRIYALVLHDKCSVHQSPYRSNRFAARVCMSFPMNHYSLWIILSSLMAPYLRLAHLIRHLRAPMPAFSVVVSIRWRPIGSSYPIWMEKRCPWRRSAYHLTHSP